MFLIKKLLTRETGEIRGNMGNGGNEGNPGNGGNPGNKGNFPSCDTRASIVRGPGFQYERYIIKRNKVLVLLQNKHLQYIYQIYFHILEITVVFLAW